MSGTTCPRSLNPIPVMAPKASGLADLSGRSLNSSQEAASPTIAPLRMGCIGPECVLFEEKDDGMFCWELRALKAQASIPALLERLLKE